jgi:P-type Na+/K+ transporter
MMLVLIIAMIVSFAIKSWIEAGVIAAVIGLNIVIGFIQEYKAGKTMDSLRSLSSPTANVVRDGDSRVIPTAEMVPGDMVELKTGDTVPADLRLLDSINFETDEALLTGESLPVLKDEEAVFDEDTGPGDRLNVAYSSSTVTKGRARGIAYATGMKTEIGAIAAALRKGDSKVRPVKRREDGSAHPFRYAQSWSLTAADAVGRFLGVNVGTPLQKKLSRLAMLLFGIAIVCAIIVMAANWFSNNAEVIIYAVATGISMLPASLIVVLTIAMAVGTRRMVERHVIVSCIPYAANDSLIIPQVRKLDALEALGGVTDICSDKTGTLTQGKMVAKKCWIPSKGTYSVGQSNQPYNPTMGDLLYSKAAPRDLELEKENYGYARDYRELLQDNGPLEDFLFTASLANLATVHETKGEWHARGDPTEIAIQVFASRFDFNRSKFLDGHAEWKQMSEYPFDSDVKKMSVIFEHLPTHKQMIFTKGAVERIIDSCESAAWESSEVVEMSDAMRNTILENMEALASLGLRVLALASRPYNPQSGRRASREGPPSREEVERNLVFRGLIGLYDPPRPESAASVKACHGAGIAVHMLTGDHPGTARAIAAQVGILPNMDMVAKDVADSMVVTAKQFDQMLDDDIDILPVLPLVIARCAPQTKVRMIEALHRRKAFAAMVSTPLKIQRHAHADSFPDRRRCERLPLPQTRGCRHCHGQIRFRRRQRRLRNYPDR